MADIFAESHRQAARKAELDAAKKAHETMVERATTKGAMAGKPKPVERPFVPSKAPWEPR